MANRMSEQTLPIAQLKRPWPGVPGAAVGQIAVTVLSGRRMRVEEIDAWIICANQQGEEVATGPYCSLRALDDREISVIWPRDWYALPGDTIDMLKMNPDYWKHFDKLATSGRRKSA